MTGPWKGWKAKPRLSTLSTAPWESRKSGEISTFPQPRRRAGGKVENQNQVSHFSTRRPRLRYWLFLTEHHQPETRKEASLDRIRPPGAPDFQAHPALETNGRFRLIPHWNQNSDSGSFLDWKMLRRRDRAILRRLVTDVSFGRKPSPSGGSRCSIR